MSRIFTSLLILCFVFGLGSRLQFKSDLTSNDVKKNKYSVKSALNEAESFKGSQSGNQDFKKIEADYKNLKVEEMVSLLETLQQETSALDSFNYEQFSNEQLRSYNENLRKRVVLKNLLFKRKFAKWAQL